MQLRQSVVIAEITSVRSRQRPTLTFPFITGRWICSFKFQLSSENLLKTIQWPRMGGLVNLTRSYFRYPSQTPGWLLWRLAGYKQKTGGLSWIVKLPNSSLITMSCVRQPPDPGWTLREEASFLHNRSCNIIFTHSFIFSTGTSQSSFLQKGLYSSPKKGKEEEGCIVKVRAIILHHPITALSFNMHSYSLFQDYPNAPGFHEPPMPDRGDSLKGGALLEGGKGRGEEE